jgi:hypothetical protein
MNKSCYHVNDLIVYNNQKAIIVKVKFNKKEYKIKLEKNGEIIDNVKEIEIRYHGNDMISKEKNIFETLGKVFNEIGKYNKNIIIINIIYN